VEHILSDSGASILLASDALIARLGRALETDARVASMSELLPAEPLEPMPRTGDDFAQVIYTSGSTGLPKGVVLSHDNLRAGMRAVVEYLAISREDRIASLLPFSFDYGLNQLLCAVGTGACLVIERSPVPAAAVRTVAAEQVTVMAAVPPLWSQLLDSDAFVSTPLPRLRILTNSGGRLPTAAVGALRRHHPGADLVLMYGLTEAFRSTWLPPETVGEKPTSIGRAIPGAEILVLDEEGRSCEPGEVGELVHRGPTVAQGYWNDPEASERVFRPDPEHPQVRRRVVFSGDLVSRDEDGDLFFVGRRDRLIKSLGHRVSPDEVADVLYSSGEVSEVVVSSEEDERLGARIVAFVVLKEEGSLERLETFADTELPRYMRPARIEVRRGLPRTPSGKHDVAAASS
jgi:acyl-CoA synthetase (AMP-forming)/AMP-acid ligase II